MRSRSVSRCSVCGRLGRSRHDGRDLRQEGRHGANCCAVPNKEDLAIAPLTPAEVHQLCKDDAILGHVCSTGQLAPQQDCLYRKGRAPQQTTTWQKRHL